MLQAGPRPRFQARSLQKELSIRNTTGARQRRKTRCCLRMGFERCRPIDTLMRRAVSIIRVIEIVTSSTKDAALVKLLQNFLCVVFSTFSCSIVNECAGILLARVLLLSWSLVRYLQNVTVMTSAIETPGEMILFQCMCIFSMWNMCCREPSQR